MTGRGMIKCKMNLIESKLIKEQYIKYNVMCIKEDNTTGYV